MKKLLFAAYAKLFRQELHIRPGRALIRREAELVHDGEEVIDNVGLEMLVVDPTGVRAE